SLQVLSCLRRETRARLIPREVLPGPRLREGAQRRASLAGNGRLRKASTRDRRGPRGRQAGPDGVEARLSRVIRPAVRQPNSRSRSPAREAGASRVGSATRRYELLGQKIEHTHGGPQLCTPVTN